MTPEHIPKEIRNAPLTDTQTELLHKLKPNFTFTHFADLPVIEKAILEIWTNQQEPRLRKYFYEENNK